MRKFDLKIFVITTAVCIALFAMFTTPEASAKGKRYGLFIGINAYQGGINQLEGAVNDAKNLRALMISQFGFLPADTKILLDDQATRANIIASVNAYANVAGEGDLFFVSYSGHGTLFPDADSEDIDEKTKISVDLTFGKDDHYTMPLDYYDSAICPVDSAANTSGKAWGNIILDDEIYDMFSQFSAKGAKVVFISDSCHSGSISKEESKGKKGRPRFTTPNSIFGGKKFTDIKFRKPGVQRSVTSVQYNGSYLALTGSKDNEVSWDATVANIPQGLFTSNLIGVIKKAGAKAKLMNYEQLMNLVQAAVVSDSKSEYPTQQTPQLDLDFGDPSARIFEP